MRCQESHFFLSFPFFCPLFVGSWQHGRTEPSNAFCFPDSHCRESPNWLFIRFPNSCVILMLRCDWFCAVVDLQLSILRFQPPSPLFQAILSLSILPSGGKGKNKPVVISIIVGLVKSLDAKAAYEGSLEKSDLRLLLFQALS